MEEDGIIFLKQTLNSKVAKDTLISHLQPRFMPITEGLKNYSLFRRNRNVIQFMMQMQKQRVKAQW